jgi:hypothetical protein
MWLTSGGVAGFTLDCSFAGKEFHVSEKEKPPND